MALTNLVTSFVLDVYDHDATPASVKAIALDKQTRYIKATLTYRGADYPVDENATVTLTVIRPDNVGVQVTGSVVDVDNADRTGTIKGVSAELSQTALALKGNLKAQVMVSVGDQILRTEIFTIKNGEALDADVSEWAGEYQGYNLDELVQTVNDVVTTVTGMEADVSDLKEGLNAAYKSETITREYIGASVVEFSVSNGDTLKIKNETNGTLRVRLRASADSTTNLQDISVPANATAFKTATASASYLSVYFNAVGTASIENGNVISLDKAETKTARNLNTYTGASDINLSTAVQGAYLYDGSLSNSENYKRIDIALGDAVAVNIIGSTANAFCLYHFLNGSGKIIKSNANTATQTNYNLFLEVPETAETLRFSFQLAEESAVTLFDLSAKDKAIINESKDSIEINLANARDGGYSYDGNFHPTSTTYKYAEIDVRGYKQIHLIGTTQNAFCLWRIRDTYGNPIKTAEYVDNNKRAYDLMLDIPLTAKSVLFTFNKNEYAYAELIALSDGYIKNIDDNSSYVHDVQKAIAEEWCFPFVDVGDLGCGYQHIIPETAQLWSSSGTKDLNQINALMSDGVHPFFGDGLVLMYGADIARQMALIPPAYTSSDTVQANMWQGKTMLWLGTSIPAGSDPSAGSGAAYPDIVAEQLGATVINKARGSSCVRINSSQGDYKNMYYPHFLRSLSRMVSEVDDIVANWSTIQPNIAGAPSTLSADEIATMKAHSYENLLMPYLNGTNAMPDVFVIDHGHNDKRPKGADGGYDMYVDSSYENIMTGKVAVDTWMVANGYANLKTALNSDLSKVGNINQFASTLNRNTFKGAMNFIITLILRYNPRARIIIVSEYN